ncbi:MAG: hypothetical protein JNJ94_16600 [Chlorobi bacterium]|jgi:hypothetical protein|nr:hypothetical protein [Chlorobiota bacterium]
MLQQIFLPPRLILVAAVAQQGSRDSDGDNGFFTIAGDNQGGAIIGALLVAVFV